jgi:hypothetical protein
VVAGRAGLRSFRAFMHIPAITASPNYFFSAFKDLIFLNIFQEGEKPFFMSHFCRCNGPEYFDEFREPFFFRNLGKLPSLMPPIPSLL